MSSITENDPPVAVAPAAFPTSENLWTPAQTGPQNKPLAYPAKGTQQVQPAILLKEQQAAYDWLLDRAKKWETITCKVTAKSGPLTEDEKFWLTRECLLRYLRATKWDQAAAEKRLLDTLAWRREFGLYDTITPEHISPENETGKQVILGFDNQGRPCQYLSPGLQNTEVSHRQVEHLVFMLERSIDLMPADVETLALLINFKAGQKRTNTAPGIGQGREVLNILQTYYPERLGRALIINVPWIVNGFFKLITPFIDPLTREKLKFNDDMNKFVPSEQLWTEFNGKLEFNYDHTVYWDALVKMCQSRRNEQHERWKKAGSVIGEHEAYLKGSQQWGANGKLDDNIETLKKAELPNTESTNSDTVNA